VNQARPIAFDDAEVRPSLPQLAWALRLRGRTATLQAGSAVELGDGTCSEGVWSSDELDLRTFAMPERRAGVHFFGSAAVRITASAVLCFPPTHTLEALYLVIPHDGSRLTVTNSIVWAMRDAGASNLTVRELSSLKESIHSCTEGLLAYNRLLLETRAASLVRIMYTPFVVDLGTDVFAEEPVSFVRDTSAFTYAQYKEALLAAMRRCLRNAASPNRPYRRARLYSTMSSGYDSTACAALAKELGFTDVLSLDTGRGGADDSGRRAGTEMGLTVRLFPRPGNGLESPGERIPDSFVDVATMRQATGKSYAEFIAPLANYGDLVFDAFEPVLPGAIILTGFHADPVWKPDCATGPWIKRSDASGSGLTEFRLRTGFVHVPVPYIHCLRWQSIKKLSNSPEMRPYHWGHPYNKPIARRLGEEAGASRESFGVKKKAANVMLRLAGEPYAPFFDEIAARYD
jgi:hypothetical protein